MKQLVILIISASLHYAITGSRSVLSNPFELKEWVCKKKVVSGKVVPIKKYNYLVSVQVGKYHGCVGVIVNHQMILIPAECLESVDTEELSIRAGSAKWDVGGEVINVKKIIKHPKYNSENYDYDAAILKLKTELNFGSNIGEALLWNEKALPKRGGTAVGWGVLTENGPSHPQLRATSMRLKNCADHYMDEEITEAEGIFCAGGGKACEGDMGNALIHNGAVFGISSWGDRCTKPCLPGIYTSIYGIIDFIRKTENESGDDDDDNDDDDDDGDEDEETDGDEDEETDGDEDEETDDDDEEEETTDYEDEDTTDGDTEITATSPFEPDEEIGSLESFIISSICFIPRLIVTILVKIFPPLAIIYTH